MLRKRDIVLYVDKVVQHRGVLREKQRRGKQQWAKKFTHVDRSALRKVYTSRQAALVATPLIP